MNATSPVMVINRCYIHACIPQSERTFWCEHIKEYIESGEDRIWYAPGTEMWVPIFPLQHISAYVKIHEETIHGRARMELIHITNLGSRLTYSLGLWSPPEAAVEIRRSVIDLFRAQLHPLEKITSDNPIITRCPDRMHDFSQQMQIKKINSPEQRLLCLWNIAFEKACTFCIQDSEDPSGSNFGVDDSILDKPRWR